MAWPKGVPRSGAPLAPCGTPNAYRRHVYRHEPVDEACRHAHAVDERLRYRAKVWPPEALNAATPSERAEEYAWLRSWDETPQRAAARIGVAPSTGWAYEQRYRKQRQDHHREEAA